MPYIGFYSQGGGGGGAICNTGAAVNSTLSSSVTGPYAAISMGGVGVATNIMFGMSGQWTSTYLNRTVTEWQVDLASGVETIGASVTIPAGLSEPSGITSHKGVYDAPCFVFRHQIGALGVGLGVIFPNGNTYILIRGDQWTGTGTGKRFVYKNGIFYFSAADQKIRAVSTAGLVLWDSGSSPTIALTGSALGAEAQSMAADSSYVYVQGIGTANIYQLNISDLTTNATLTHPQGVSGGNLVIVDEYGTLWAVSTVGIWRHDGSNSWTQTSSSIGSAGGAGENSANPTDLNIMWREVLYRLDVNSVNGNYNLYKSIQPC